MTDNPARTEERRLGRNEPAQSTAAPKGVRSAGSDASHPLGDVGKPEALRGLGLEIYGCVGGFMVYNHDADACIPISRRQLRALIALQRSLLGHPSELVSHQPDVLPRGHLLLLNNDVPFPLAHYQAGGQSEQSLSSQSKAAPEPLLPGLHPGLMAAAVEVVASRCFSAEEVLRAVEDLLSALSRQRQAAPQPPSQAPER